MYTVEIVRVKLHNVYYRYNNLKWQDITVNRDNDQVELIVNYKLNLMNDIKKIMNDAIITYQVTLEQHIVKKSPSLKSR